MFQRYPGQFGLSPSSFDGVTVRAEGARAGVKIALQCVPDRFYFLLFGAICMRLRRYYDVHADLVVVRSINGALGTGWIAWFKRSALVSWFQTGPWIRAFGSLVNGIAYRSAGLSRPDHFVRDWRESRRLWNAFREQSPEVEFRLTVCGIEIADLIVSSYLRYKPAPAFDVNDPFVRVLLMQALRDIRRAEEYFGGVRPALYVTSYTTYIEHGIPARIACKCGVNVWSFGNLNRFGKKLSTTDPYQTLDYSRFKADFANLPDPDACLAEARALLENRLAGGIDPATSYMRQSAYADSGAELPPDLEGAVIVFLHDFYDSPHVYPDLIFNDFWQWICFTIETLRAAKVPFFLKPHPNQIALSDGALVRLRDQYPDLRWISPSTTNVKLAQGGISCGVTVYGTVAHELAYLGVPSIGCARHPHHSFQFCRTAHSRVEYAALLKEHAVRPVSNDEMRLQALQFYYMHNLSGDPDQVALRTAFGNFWRACNVGTSDDDSAMSEFQSLATSPAFDRVVIKLIHSQVVEKSPEAVSV